MGVQEEGMGVEEEFVSFMTINKVQDKYLPFTFLSKLSICLWLRV